MFNLFTDADGLYRRKMLYSLPFHAADGRLLILQGDKEVWDHGHFDVWGSTTTLYTSLVDGDDPDRPTLATGVLKLNLPMFARQLTTMRITGARNGYANLKGLSSFGGFFAGNAFRRIRPSPAGRVRRHVAHKGEPCQSRRTASTTWWLKISTR